MADYKDVREGEVEIEDLNDLDFVKKHGYFIACIVQRLLCNQKTPTLCNEVFVIPEALHSSFDDD